MGKSKTDLLLQATIGVLAAALVSVVAFATRETVVGVGDKAPDFSIRADSGQTISRGDFGGRLLVLNFWATWCPPCIEEMPSLDEFQKQFRDAGVVVLGVSVDEDEGAYRRFLERAGVSFSTARDPEAALADKFGTYRYPETYVINRDGKVVQKIIGEADWTDARMVSYIKSLL
ncbi:MAG: TlpA family protein disulfide reductase [Bryobacteraceae bacterium]|nr:TlpA family protein disulfide reductase [Bryobacteraceae bacterium]